jgi:hypothetical protein
MSRVNALEYLQLQIQDNFSQIDDPLTIFNDEAADNLSMCQMCQGKFP